MLLLVNMLFWIRNINLVRKEMDKKMKIFILANSPQNAINSFPSLLNRKDVHLATGLRHLEGYSDAYLLYAHEWWKNENFEHLNDFLIGRNFIHLKKEIPHNPKDYKKLYKIVKSGKRVPCYVDHKFNTEQEVPFRDICTVEQTKIDIKFYTRGISYGYVDDLIVIDTKKTEEECFIMECKRLNVFWMKDGIK